MRPDFRILLLSAISCSACAAQSLTVTAAPFSPASAGVEAGVAFTKEVVAFRFSAAGGAFTLNGFTLTNGGSGNWATELSGVNGVEVWRDDGDGVFSSATDLSLFQGVGAQPSVTATLSSAQNIAAGNAADFWIVLNFLASAGGSVPTTFSTAISSITDVSASGGTVQLGSPAPASGTLSVVIFFVIEVQPGSGSGGESIVVLGSGFTAPVTLEIGGRAAAGTPSISANGTTITGWICPGMGGLSGRVSIVLSTGLLGPTTLSQTWRIPTSDEAGKGCTTSESADLLLATLSTFGITMMLLRLHRRQVSGRHLV